jgi:uncharacterized protein (DUF1778 family)
MCCASTKESEMKSSHVKMTAEQLAAIEIAADRVGLPVSTFLRFAALEKAEAMGIVPEQPKAD